MSCSNKSKKETAVRHSLTPEMAQTLRQSMKKDLSGSDIQKTNDLNKYCDCIVDSLQISFTMAEIMEPEFTSSRKYRKLQDTCLKSTKLQ
jgi:hypothetical protein